MKFSFFQKMRLWHPGADTLQKKKRGALTLLAAFLFVIFSILGLGMLYVSQIYLKISGYKSNVGLLELASENGIKQGFKQLLISLSALPNPQILSGEEMEVLRLDALQGGTGIIDKLKASTSSTQTSSWERMSWESRLQWAMDYVEPKNKYFRAGFIIHIMSEGKLENFRPSKRTALELEMAVAAGEIPLAQFPVLLDQNLTSDGLADFIQKNPIELHLPAQNTITQQIHTTEEPILPRSGIPLLEEALHIELFEPGSLAPAQLREALGLEVSNDPVPDGVYLIRDDTGLSGAFVQGDCDEMILAIDGESQIISFVQGDLEWILCFCPAKKRTEFQTPEGTQIFDHIPQGIILVDGTIHSLGGGYVDSSGHVELLPDEEIPCLLEGVNLTLVCSDEIVLSSHLILQGVRWQDGIPYVKDSSTMLNIFASGEGLLDGTEKKGRITVGETAPQEIKIQASLTASGQGFAIAGKDKTVHLHGSLQASDYTSNGNALKASWDERFLDQDGLLAHTPRSAKPVLSVLFLRAAAWKDEPDTFKN